MYSSLSTNGLSVGQKDKKVAIISIDVNATNELFCQVLYRSFGKAGFDFISKPKARNLG
jgi:hypothetical protein